jgi:hypothetical protein
VTMDWGTLFAIVSTISLLLGFAAVAVQNGD